MKKVKLFGILALAALTIGAATYAVVSANEPDAKTEAAHSDAWEAAANEANAKKEVEAKNDVAEVVKDEKGNVIDEDYVKKEIDTPTGAEAKAEEDKYLDAAEKEVTRVEKETTDTSKEKEVEKSEKSADKPQSKKLPKTSAVK